MTTDDMIAIGTLIIAGIGILTTGYIVQLLVKLLGHSIPEDKIESLVRGTVTLILNEADRRAKESAYTWDDSIVEELRKRYGLQPTEPSQPIPPTQPTTPTLPKSDYKWFYTFGKRSEASYTWQQEGHDNAVIEIPLGFDHVRHAYDNDNKWYPHKAINTDSKYGTRFNIASVAFRDTITTTDTLDLPAGRYTVALEYEASINQKVTTEPFFNWIQFEARLGNVRCFALGEGIYHHNCRNGKHVISWQYETVTPVSAPLALQVAVHWGSALGDSTIDLKKLTVASV